MQCKYNALTKIVQKYNLMVEKGANMATTNFTMRIDEAVKAQFQELMNDEKDLISFMPEMKDKRWKEQD